ncbi:MAG: hypothetical protein Kilf2KO_45120 [Rhodospirillales bacterium]
MPLELNGAQVLKTVLAKPEVFPLIHGELNRLVQSLLVKQLRHRSLTVAELRAIASALGHDSFLLLVDAMNDGEVKSLAARLDPHHDGLRSADPSWQRRHLTLLAEGDAEPQPKDGLAIAPAASPQATRTMSSRAMAAIARPRDDTPAKSAVKAKGKDKPKAPAKGKAKPEGKAKKKKGKG